MNNRSHPQIRNALYFFALVCFGGFFPLPGLAQTIVWTDINGRRIQSKNVSGGPVQTIVQYQSPQNAYQVHYDPISPKLYFLYSNGGTSTFRRSNLDGSNQEDIPTPNLVETFSLNVELRKLYWRNANSLYRSALAGTAVESHAYPTCCIFTLAALGDTVFFGAGAGMMKGVWRADADGSNEQLLHEGGPPMGLAYDSVEEKLYLATTEGIYRLNSDGTAYQAVLLGPEVTQIVVDIRGRKLYWTDRQVIQRSDLNGANVEIFVTAADAGVPSLDVQGLTIVAPPAIPTVSDWGFAIMVLVLVIAGIVVLRGNGRIVPRFCRLEARESCR